MGIVNDLVLWIVLGVLELGGDVLVVETLEGSLRLLNCQLAQRLWNSPISLVATRDGHNRTVVIVGAGLLAVVSGRHDEDDEAQLRILLRPQQFLRVDLVFPSSPSHSYLKEKRVNLDGASDADVRDAGVDGDWLGDEWEVDGFLSRIPAVGQIRHHPLEEGAER